MNITLPSGRIIGDDQPIFVIAEIGSNWSSLEDCLTSIRVAKVCGADAVKFQLFDYETLFGLPHIIDENNRKYVPMQLPIGWLPELKAQADSVGIEFMCSAFNPELIDVVNPFVNIHKLASSEMCHLRMLQKLKILGKPLIMSTGAHTLPDIEMAYKQVAGIQKVMMYCEAAYPAKWTNMNKLLLLKEKYNLVGFSDHSLDIFTNPMAANKNGACVLEKHANFSESKGPDSGHSLNQKEFTAMVEALRGTYLTIFGPSPDEMDMLYKHKRRLIATKDIKQGELVKEGENFGIFRSLVDDTLADSPFMIDSVNGKVAKRAIKAGEGIRCDSNDRGNVLL